MEPLRRKKIFFIPPHQFCSTAQIYMCDGRPFLCEVPLVPLVDADFTMTRFQLALLFCIIRKTKTNYVIVARLPSPLELAVPVQQFCERSADVVLH